MNLVVYSNLDMSLMLMAVADIFSDIPKRRVFYSKYKPMPFEHHLNRILIHKTEKAAPSVKIMWQIPSLRKYNKHQVDYLIKYVMSQYTEGTITELLQKRGISISTHCTIVKTRYFYMFDFIVELSTKDIQNVNEAVSIIYQFIHNMKLMPLSQFYSYWKEYIQVSQVKFNFLLDSEAFTFVL